MSIDQLDLLAQRHRDAALLAREFNMRDHAEMHMRLRRRYLARLRALKKRARR